MLTKKSLIVVAMISFGGINGIGDFIAHAHGGSQQTLLVPSVIIWAILIKMWFSAEWQEKQIQPSAFYRIGVWAITLVAVPWYFLKYRGIRNGSIAVVISIGILVAEHLAYMAAWYATQAMSD
jgi:hypothetical protein